MLFNSYIFILGFLPITLTVYFSLNHFHRERMATMWLCGASLFFYGFFNWAYLPIMLFSIAFNYCFSRVINPDIERGGWCSRNVRKGLFCIGLLVNIGVLFGFKYFDFFVENINILFGTEFRLLHFILPLGISFFTFQQLSFLIDSYLGKAPVYPLLDYALFVTFFPQLIAGPIVLHSEIVPQFIDRGKKRFNSDNFAKGLMVFSCGLAKKVLLADTFAAAVDVGFADITSLGSINALIVMVSYTFQIYFDFSGYCDMAVGIGKFFNIDIPMNFNLPYRAITITDFWNRWHITLTRFFTTYVYIPLGGNRRGTIWTYVNVMIVFFISGLWHGANWTFILWGCMHGIASVVTRIMKKTIDKWPMAFSWLCTFMFVNITWVIFRSDNIIQAIDFFKQLFSMKFITVRSEIISAFTLREFTLLLSDILRLPETVCHLQWAAFLVLGLLICLLAKNTNEKIKHFKPTISSAAASALLTVWSVISLSGVSVFLYWNF